MSKSAQESREYTLEFMRAATPALLERFYEELQRPGVGLDDLRKALDLTLRTTGVEVKEKTDNLPTVNITIVNNRSVVESVAPPLEVLEDLKGQMPTISMPSIKATLKQEPQRKPKEKLVPLLNLDDDLSDLDKLI